METGGALVNTLEPLPSVLRQLAADPSDPIHMTFPERTMRRPFAYTMLALALGTAGCGTDETSLNNDEQAVLQSLNENVPAWTEESPGVDGAVADVAGPPAADGLVLAPGDTFHPPAFWGRFRRMHSPGRERVVVIEGDTARVNLTVAFNGVFVVDSTMDGVRNPGSKPLHETARQRALFVRDTMAPRGWRLVGLSVRRFQNSAPGERTVNITSIAVKKNNDAPAVLDDPEAFLSPATLTSLSVGDTLAVVVHATNTTGTDLVPPTQLFIHVRHFNAGNDLWARFPMRREDDGTYRAKWAVRRPGAAIVAVDALDSETLTTQTGDDYRSDLWAVPVRVE